MDVGKLHFTYAITRRFFEQQAREHARRVETLRAEQRLLELSRLEHAATALRDDRLWKEKEAATYLGMSTRWLRSSSVPKVMLPGAGERGSVRYDPAEVKAWARQHLTHTVRRT